MRLDYRSATSIAAFLAACLTTLPAHGQHQLPPAKKIVVPDAGSVIPMGSLDGRPLVDVRINGKGPYSFIVDTGADHTVIDQDLAKELSLPSSAIPEMGPATLMASGARVDDLSVGTASLQGIVISAGPFSAMFGRADAPRGVLSAAAFPGYLLTLDYPEKKILIRKGELTPADSQTIFQYTAEHILPNVPLRVAGTEVRVHVDSGSPAALMLPEKYMKELTLKTEPAQIGRGRTPHGEFKIWSAQIEGGAQLGRFKLELSDLRFANANPIPGPPVGNLGYQVLKRFKVTLDAKNRRIAFAE